MKRLLIAGYGDIGRRVAALLPRGVEMRALSRTLGADLDRPGTLSAHTGWADAILHAAPPPAADDTDPRTGNLLSVVLAECPPKRIVYISTSGVYGDCGGDFVDETRPVNPMSMRAKRRVDAERRLQHGCAARGVALVVLRVPGIYAADRLPLDRLRARTPALRPEDDGYTNHIHADDLASIALRALADDAPAGVFNACDDSMLRAGEWFDLVADRAGLPRPPRIARHEAAGRIPEATLSFLRESRRLVNSKMKRELGVRLAYPTVFEGVPHLVAAA